MYLNSIFMFLLMQSAGKLLVEGVLLKNPKRKKNGLRNMWEDKADKAILCCCTSLVGSGLYLVSASFDIAEQKEKRTGL